MMNPNNGNDSDLMNLTLEDLLPNAEKTLYGAQETSLYPDMHSLHLDEILSLLHSILETDGVEINRNSPAANDNKNICIPSIFNDINVSSSTGSVQYTNPETYSTSVEAQNNSSFSIPPIPNHLDLDLPTGSTQYANADAFNTTVGASDNNILIPPIPNDMNLHWSTDSEACNTLDSMLFTTGHSFTQDPSLYVTSTPGFAVNKPSNLSNITNITTEVTKNPVNNYEPFLDFLVDSQSYETSMGDSDRAGPGLNYGSVVQTTPPACTAQHIYNLPQDFVTIGNQEGHQTIEVISNNGIPTSANIIFNQHFGQEPHELRDEQNDSIYYNYVSPNDRYLTTSSPLNNQRPIISCRPLQMRIPEKCNNQDITDIIEWNEDTSQDNELMQIHQSVPEIPILNCVLQPERKSRKQALKPLTDDEMSILNDQGNFSVIDDRFVTIGIKRKKSPTSFECGGSSMRSSGFGSLESVEQTNASAILISSDSESDHEGRDICILKCFKCQKMFKGSTSFGKHKKICHFALSADSNNSNDIVFLDETVELVDSDSESAGSARSPKQKNKNQKTTRLGPPTNRPVTRSQKKI